MRVRELSGRLWTVFLYLLPQAGLHLQRDEEKNEYQSEPESPNDLIAVVVLTVNRTSLGAPVSNSNFYFEPVF